MTTNILSKKIIKDVVKLLNKYNIAYRVNIKDKTYKNNLFNKKIIIYMDVKNNNK